MGYGGWGGCKVECWPSLGVCIVFSTYRRSRAKINPLYRRFLVPRVTAVYVAAPGHAGGRHGDGGGGGYGYGYGYGGGFFFVLFPLPADGPCGAPEEPPVAG